MKKPTKGVLWHKVRFFIMRVFTSLILVRPATDSEASGFLLFANARDHAKKPPEAARQKLACDDIYEAVTLFTVNAAPRVRSVTIIDAIHTPIRIEKNAFFRGSPNTNAARLPVQAPVTGSGTATKSASARCRTFRL